MYNLKIIRSGNRLEIYKFNDYVVKFKDDFVQTDENILDLPELRESKDNKYFQDKKRKETLNVARNNIIRLIQSNSDMMTFITLTFAEEQDFKESKKSLNNLFNKLRRRYLNLKYLWVLEYGSKNNRLHYHLLCNIGIDIELCDSKTKKSDSHKELENNFQKRYWKYGFVDIRSLNQECNTNIALYVSVYITKSMANRDLEGYRVYGYSQKTLIKPIEEFYYSLDAVDNVLESFSGDYDVKFTNSYPIGYVSKGKERTGNVTYIDLELKGDI